MADLTLTDGGRSLYFKGEVGDCFVRALAIASSQDYLKVYNKVKDACKQDKSKRKSSQRTGMHVKLAKKIMEDLGWLWVPTMAIGSGCTTHLRADELPKGRLLCRLSKHYAAVVDGVVHDNHDPRRGGTRCVYGYWRKDDG